MTIRTAEFVTPKHPDKICDFIADSILDAYLKIDENARVAVEVMGGHRLVTLNGEITSIAQIDLEEIVREIVGSNFEIDINVARQSQFIAQGVDGGGAGDQGIMIGYATAETETGMPLEYELARSLCRRIFESYPVDGKVQVTVSDNQIQTVVASFEGTKTEELLSLVRSLIAAEEYFVNPAGEWPVGGFDSDSGLSGRKLVVDNYGPRVPIGGGSFSGKDCTKVDRSGAYMARRIAVDYLKKFDAKEVLVRLAYAIGKAEPVMAIVEVDGKAMPVEGYDLSPEGIAKFLDLKRPIYAKTCQWGHFGEGFTWG